MGVCNVFLAVLGFLVVEAVPLLFKESSPNGESIVSISSSDPNVEKYWTQQLATRSGFTQLTEKDEEKDLPYKSNPGVIQSSYSLSSQDVSGRSFASASSGPGQAVVSTGRGFASASSGSGPVFASSGRGFSSASSSNVPVIASAGRGFASAASSNTPVIGSGRGFASNAPGQAIVSTGRGFASASSGSGPVIASSGRGFASASSSSGPAFVSTGRGFSGSSGPFFPFFAYPYSPNGFGYNTFDLNDWMRNFESFYNPNFPGNGPVSASATAVNDNGHFYGKVDTVDADNKAKSVTFDSNDKKNESEAKDKH